MTKRVLVAVDDSAASLAAARGAVELAADLHAGLLAVHVLTDGVVTEAIAAASGHPDLAARRDAAAASVLKHVVDLADRAEVHAQTAQVFGDVAASVLQEARRWSADLIVVGRSARHRAGEPVLSDDVQHIIEFATQPVVIMPPAGDR